MKALYSMVLTEGEWILGEGTGYMLISEHLSITQHSSLRAGNAGINSEINLQNALDTDRNVIRQDRLQSLQVKASAVSPGCCSDISRCTSLSAPVSRASQKRFTRTK